jgi:isopenicillin N synthase-like dioxygenase
VRNLEFSPPAAKAFGIPVLDLSRFEHDAKARLEIASKWDEAFSSVGFCSLIGHGLTPELIDRMYHTALEFFALPQTEKIVCRDPHGRDEGYFALATEAVGRSMGLASPPDLCETIQFLNLQRGGQAMTSWPESIHALWQDAHTYALEAAALSQRLLRISARALDLPESHFEPYYTNMTTKIRFVLYPDQVEEPLPGQLRNAPHTDFNGFTILRQDAAPGGLQVRVGDDAWVDVIPVDGALVINAGDLIQRWTNDRWRSNVHRVINPPRSLTGSSRRLSIVFFTGPSPDAEIACLPSCIPCGETARYSPIIAAAHLKEKIRLTFETS